MVLNLIICVGRWWGRKKGKGSRFYYYRLWSLCIRSKGCRSRSQACVFWWSTRNSWFLLPAHAPHTWHKGDLQWHSLWEDEEGSQTSECSTRRCDWWRCLVPSIGCWHCRSGCTWCLQQGTSCRQPSHRSVFVQSILSLFVLSKLSVSIEVGSQIQIPTALLPHKVDYFAAMMISPHHGGLSGAVCIYSLQIAIKNLSRQLTHLLLLIQTCVGFVRISLLTHLRSLCQIYQKLGQKERMITSYKQTSFQMRKKCLHSDIPCPIIIGNNSLNHGQINELACLAYIRLDMT